MDAKLRRRLMMAVGIISFACYWNFGFFHFRNYIHVWDTYHYYIGSKYFPELSYDRLYDCVSVADSEEPGLRRRVELRKIMNLRTNMMGPTTEILAHPERCKEHFTPERWQAFKHDVAYFRNAHGVKRWEEAQTDHGYNATPVWTILGTTLANLAPASDTQIDLLSLLDPAYAFGMVGLIWWAFGWRTLAVALCVFATNFPSRFYWTGGAYLRWDWLFYLAGGVALLRKQKYFAGGLFLSYSTLLRVFPVFRLHRPAHGAGAGISEDAQARSALPIAHRRRGAGRGGAGAAQPGQDRRHPGLRSLQAEQREAHVDAAHELHGPAHADRLRAVGGGASS